MERLGVLSALKNAFQELFRNFGIALFIAVIAGGVGDVVMYAAGGWIATTLLPHLSLAGDPATHKQLELIISQLAQLGVGIAWYGPVGAWAAGATIYLWVMREKKKSATLYDAVNYGLNRLPHTLNAHWKAFTYIALGSIIIVPAILLGLQYAFVDAIATLDDEEPKPLARSKRLTLPRRGTIFRSFLPFMLWWIPYNILSGFGLLLDHVGYQFLCGVMNLLVIQLIDLVMVQLYLDLFRDRAAKPAS